MSDASDAELERLIREAEQLETAAQTTAAEAKRKRQQAEQKKRELLRKEEEVQELRTEAAGLQRKVEEEEEFIANGLLKRLDVLKKEKEQLVKQVEVEEEFLVNSLQKQLTNVSKEKDDLEKHLQRERRFIVTKLQKQLRQAVEQKKSLERMVDADEKSKADLLNQVNVYRVAVGEAEIDCNATPQNSTTFDSDTDSTFSAFSESTQYSAGNSLYDGTIRKLQKEILRLQALCANNSSSAQQNAEQCESLRIQLEQTSQDNFLKDLKCVKLREELSKATADRVRVLKNTTTPESLSESEMNDIRTRKRRTSSSGGSAVGLPGTPNSRHPLKAHTEDILKRPPPSPRPNQPWLTPPVTPCLSPRSGSVNSGTSTPTLSASRHAVPKRSPSDAFDSPRVSREGR